MDQQPGLAVVRLGGPGGIDLAALVSNAEENTRAAYLTNQAVNTLAQTIQQHHEDFHQFKSSTIAALNQVTGEQADQGLRLGQVEADVGANKAAVATAQAEAAAAKREAAAMKKEMAELKKQVERVTVERGEDSSATYDPAYEAATCAGRTAKRARYAQPATPRAVAALAAAAAAGPAPTALPVGRTGAGGAGTGAAAAAAAGLAQLAAAGTVVAGGGGASANLPAAVARRGRGAGRAAASGGARGRRSRPGLQEFQMKLPDGSLVSMQDADVADLKALKAAFEPTLLATGNTQKQLTPEDVPTDSVYATDPDRIPHANTEVLGRRTYIRFRELFTAIARKTGEQA